MPDEPQPKLCFVIGPIGRDGSPERKHADLLLHAVIRPVLEAKEFNYQVKRADEDADPGMIGNQMITDIINADLVVADLTDLNPNAFYELGIRHSAQGKTIHIAKQGTSLPFDNVAHRTIFVDLTDWHSQERARAMLAEAVRATKRPEYKVSNPITQANASFQLRQSGDPRDQVIAQFSERLAALEASASSGIHERPPLGRKVEPVALRLALVDVSAGKQPLAPDEQRELGNRIALTISRRAPEVMVTSFSESAVGIRLVLQPVSGDALSSDALYKALLSLSEVPGIKDVKIVSVN